MNEKDWKSKITPAVTDVDRTPVAQDIWCYSTKEKAFTWHVVVNHDANGFVDRVQCKTSKTTHKYKRQNKEATATKSKLTTATLTRRASPKAAETSANLEKIWFEGIKAWGQKVVPVYSPQQHYSAKDVLDHPTFGKGVVQARREHKIDILFQTGMKTLMSLEKKS